MGIGTGTAALIGGVATAGAGVAAGAMGASAAGHAADTQANAANNAAQLQHQDAQQALDFQKQQYGNSLQISQPWVTQGQGAITNLGYLMGMPGNYGYGGGSNPQGYGVNPTTGVPSGGDNQIGGGNGYSGMPIKGGGVTGGTFNDATGKFNDAAGNIRTVQDSGGSYDPATNSYSYTAPTSPSTSLNLPTPQVNPNLGGFGSLMTPWTQQFQAPTDITQQNDPGYQFRLNQGMKALQNSAAAKGGLLSGGTAKGLQQFGQDYASNEYGNVYNRALGQYQQNYNIFKQNQNDQYNKLANLAGMGQTSAGQLMSAGQGAANNASNILLTSGQQIGNNINNAAAARASGYIGGANAIGGALTGGTNSIMQGLLLSQLMNGRGGSIPGMDYSTFAGANGSFGG